MRILLLAPQVPYPPHKGTAIRNFHLIKHLARRHELTLLTFDDPAMPSDLTELRRHCAAIELVAPPVRSGFARLLDLMTSPTPDLVRRLWSPQLAARLGTILRERFDLVQIEGLEMALQWEAVAGAARLRLPPVVLDAHNAEYVLQRRAFEIDARQPAKWLAAAYSFGQWQKLTRYERRFCRLANGVVSASEMDRRALLALDARLRVAVVPNGVDAAHYQGCFEHRIETRQPIGDETPLKRVGDPQCVAPRLIFVGTLDFRPNVDGLLWFRDKIWPLVLAAQPEATFWIVGRSAKAAVRRLADGKRIILESDVADVRPYLAKATLAVVPLRIGGGSRLKVLEAMAAGVPIVSTTLGCEGIDVTPDTTTLADEPEDVAQAIVDLLRDELRRKELARAARSFVAKCYDWQVVVPRLEQFHREVAGCD